MVELTKIQKKIIGLGIIVILVGIGIFLYRQNQTSDYSVLELEENGKTNNQEETKVETKKMIIHVTGFVEKEGIIELEEGARIADAIKAAGGETLDADLGKVNLAYVLKDGQKIYIPSILEKEEEKEYITEGSGDNVIVDEGNKKEKEGGKAGMVNINTATQTELETLTGIGPSTASKIIEYRKQNGDFKSIEEIRNVSGIGDSRYENIKDQICI